MQIDLWNGRSPPGLEPALGAPPSLTAYLTDARAPGGALIVLPGGGYAGHAPHEAEPIALWANGMGLHAFVLRYRVAPYRHPWPLADAQRAIRVVRSRAKEWGVEPGRIGILGFSAGGHLAVSAGVLHRLACYPARDAADELSARPDFMVACYPVVSFGQHRHDGSMRNLLGESPDPELERLLSLELSVDAETPPVFVWHTANDQAVPVENSLLLASSLAAHGVGFELHVFRDGRHGLGMAVDRPDVAAWTKLCESWILKLLGV